MSRSNFESSCGINEEVYKVGYEWTKNAENEDNNGKNITTLSVMIVSLDTLVWFE